MSEKPEDTRISELIACYWHTLRKRLDDAPPEVAAELQMAFEPVTTGISPADVMALRGAGHAELPKAYREFLLCDHAEEGAIQSDELILPTPTRTAGLAGVADHLLAAEMWNVGLVQFATTAYGDPICFDFGLNDAVHDPPVVAIDHEALAPADWEVRQNVESRTRLLAPNFRHFLEQLCGTG